MSYVEQRLNYDMKEKVKEYGGGLFELAVSEGLEEVLLSEVRTLRPLMSAEYLHLLTTPAVPRSERLGLVSEAMDGRVHPYLASFVKLVTERGMAMSIPDLFDEYERRYLERHGIISVSVESAVPLTETQRERLVSRLEAHTGKRLDMTYHVVPELLGGVRLSFDDRLADGTARAALKRLSDALSETVL